MSSSFRSAILWLGSLAGSRRISPNPNTCEKQLIMPDVEFEMQKLGVPATKLREHPHRTSGHTRSKSEDSGSRPGSLPQPTYNTLPRTKGHLRNSSYTPVLVVPGVVNSSFLLFSPELHQRQRPRRASSPIARSRRMQQLSDDVLRKDEEGIAEERDSGDDMDGVSRGSFDSLFDESGRSGYPRRSSSTSSSYTAYSSDVNNNAIGCPELDHKVSDPVSHRSTYTADG